MESDLLQNAKELGDWYQKIELDDNVFTPRKGYAIPAGIAAWEQIKQFIPSSLEGMRILDLGCNAGYYCVQSSLLGANEVVGVELNKTFFKQAIFIKDLYEKKYNKIFNINYINCDIGDLDFEHMGRFDYIYAIAIIYHIGKFKFGKYTPKTLEFQKEVVSKLAKVSDNFIVRTRNKEFNSVDYYDNLFGDIGFKNVKSILTSNRSMVLYSKKESMSTAP